MGRDEGVNLEFVGKFIGWLLYTIWLGFYNTFVPYSWKTKKRLTSKKVLITGGASGIGAACAKLLVEEGCQVAIWDIHEENLANIHRELEKTGYTIYTQKVDLSNESEILKACDDLKERFGDVDILFNNAGLGNASSFLQSNTETMKYIFDVNIFAHMHIVRQLLPRMIEKGEGHIVATSSFGGICALGEFVDYSTTKFAVRGFMEALNNQLELQGVSGIEFTTVFPGYVRTPIWKEFNPGKQYIPVIDADEMAEEIVRGIKLNQKEVIYPKRLTWIMIAKA
ncbi:unnamed protein product [Bursaphelenchus xylophilus]|nr:unnamed protein product [Bursaphelenchus xylophilus]CAG9129007.1 unnamed protein product [Bursaphelenchus xylophilus]